MAAAGYAGVDFSQAQTNLYLYEGDLSVPTYTPSDHLSLHLVRNGEPYQVDEDVAAKILKQTDVSIRFDLGFHADTTQTQNHGCTMWTCDLSKEYVAINADYRS